MPNMKAKCCCGCPCGLSGCDNCDDLNPSSVRITFNGIFLYHGCVAVTNGGATTYTKYWRGDFDVDGYCVPQSEDDHCLHVSQLDNGTAIVPTVVGPDYGGWNNSFGFCSTNPGTDPTRFWTIQLKRTATGGTLEVLHGTFIHASGWEAFQPLVLTFQGSYTDSTVCCRTIVIDNELNTVGGTADALLTTDAGTPVQAATLGTGGSATIVPCCEIGI